MSQESKSIREAYREAATESSTASGIPLKAVYTPEDIKDISYDRDIGMPGQYPFTRGHHPLMYRGKLWNVRQIIGLSTPGRQNERLKLVLERGASAVDCEMDASTWYGIDPDQDYAEGQLGVNGVILHTLRDVEVMLDGLPLDELSLCWNYPLPALSQSYVLAARRRGYDPAQLRLVHSTLYFHEFVYAPSQAQRLLVQGRFSTVARWGNDFCEYIIRNFPKWNIWFADGAAFCESGATAAQEIAFILSCRNALLRELVRRGLDVNKAARFLSPVVAVDRDFFETVAKLRAARRLWAKTLKEEFGATDPAALSMRAHANVVGSVCTRQQPLVNIARGAIGSLAGVLGGCMGLQVACYDEAWCTPTEESETLALRTQQVVRYESGAARVADPLAGSYYVEWLTSKVEEEAGTILAEIESKGGWLGALQQGWVHELLKKGLLDIQRKVDGGDRVVVGVNRFSIPPEEDFRPRLYAPDTSDTERYVAQFQEFKKRRDNASVKEALEGLRRTAADPGANLVPATFHALEVDCTFAEIIGVLRMNDGLDYDWTGERQYPFA